MSKLVILNLGQGDWEKGFAGVTVRLSTPEDFYPLQFTGSLPAAPEIPESYQRWQYLYQALYESLPSRDRSTIDSDFEFEEEGVLQVSEVEFQELGKQLERLINRWLNSQEFLPTKEKLYRELNPDEEIRVIIETNNYQLRQLPWHLWHFFTDFPLAEVALSASESGKVPLRSTSTSGKVRILAILGNSVGINVAADRRELEALPEVELVLLEEPTRRELNQQLWDKQGWDILFFAGHSQTIGETGRIYLNQTESLTIPDLKYALKKAIARGLQLGIFNSCEGLGLAKDLGELQIPQLIVMREPVQDTVAQTFLRQFLASFAQGESLYLAVREAREKLQGWEDEFPGASWLPVICQNPVVVPPTWVELSGISTRLHCPYQGLSAFREEDAPYFFGRESFTQQLVKAVQKQSFVPIVGASGSGKSSVVFAGLIPQLRSQGRVQIAALRPGNRPFEALAAALLSVNPHPPTPSPYEEEGEYKAVGAKHLGDNLSEKPKIYHPNASPSDSASNSVVQPQSCTNTDDPPGVQTPGSQRKSTKVDSIKASVHFSGLNLLARSFNSGWMTKLIEDNADSEVEQGRKTECHRQKSAQINQRLAELELAEELRHNDQVLAQLIENIVTKNDNQDNEVCLNSTSDNLQQITASPSPCISASFLTPFILIVDQFEELYTLCPEEERQPFLDGLLQAVKLAPAFTLVLTLRADFYGYALSYRPFSDALQGQVLNLGPMNREELHRAITLPGEKMQVQLEEGLTNKLIDAIGEQTGRLPLLEFALSQLWVKQRRRRLTHQAYQEIGGVEKALAKYAEGVYEQLSESEQEQAQRVFIQLVRLGEGTDATRRLATRKQVKNWDLVTRLASARLVVTNRNQSTEEETVEVVHEALIRSWERLGRWLRESEDFLRWQYRLEDGMKQWESHGNQEGYLLREAPLVEALGWLEKRREELSDAQRYIQLSLELRDRELRK
ncbi:MAG: CHAT domain-containing protein, partial [Symploca sp. SIO3E6]|nr:CHAT domain-containing protein [Caldora sp. SIO3E6]